MFDFGRRVCLGAVLSWSKPLSLTMLIYSNARSSFRGSVSVPDDVVHSRHFRHLEGHRREWERDQSARCLSHCGNKLYTALYDKMNI
ncbi:uncharacterized protein LAESUDRAFT_731605 [Laetiporus sulphureus 93-53]|uniref:Uncharacterized protein n=1 Tax=Laetiporus sulphureus 93-53 TaxID=1314785 RepID=A0A165BHU2_9APHY|nr:uncharacterized protein LAESUDRAFT_731573 [Laetiporus sulphureus 93-53]XP_040758866.1 uncharacterized protein LAESUDRAFT_731605 [Laetiporus sulphureus 93-53]KZT01085.1 hypothetical protein LAESUDRAFT_731573 [Laetiporus sulphureus 93-53]KZT01126.1 hypothetical protein LAESUDRAFT_731605 [Laetiporus sulphureus 93-53]